MTLTVNPKSNTVAVAPKVLSVTVNGVSTTVATTQQAVNIVTVVKNLSLVAKEPVVSLLTMGIQGPPGPAGAGVAEPSYRLTDLDSVTDTYFKGWSNASDTSTPTWRILKGVEVSPDNFIETLADGDDLLDNVWDDRLSLTYT